MELLLLLVILPAVQDQNHTREWLKNCIKGWCSVAAWLLDLRSYLFGDDEAAGEDLAAAPEREAAGGAADGAAPVAQQPVAADPGHDGAAAAAPVAPEAAPPAAAAAAADNIDGLGAAHHALLQREAPQGTQPYVRPTFFPLRVCLKFPKIPKYFIYIDVLIQIAGLLLIMVFSGLVASLLTMVVPVWLGRQVFAGKQMF